MSQTPRNRSFFEEVVLEQTTGILTISEEGEIVYANGRGKAALNCDSEAVVGRPVTGLFADGTVTQIEDVADPETSTDRFTAAVPTATGQTETTYWSVAASQADGSRFYTLTLDRKSTERADDPGGAVDGQLEQLFDTDGEPLAVFDPDDGTLVTCTRQTRAVLGLPTEASTPLSVRESVDAPTVFVSFLQDVHTADEGRREAFTWERTEGTRSIEVVATPIESGGERLVFARIEDVTDQNQQRAQRRRRTAALDAVHDGVAVLDTAYEHRYVNEAYTRLFADGAREDLTGEPLARVVETDRRFDREIRPTVEREGQWRGQLTCETAAGPTQVDAVFERLEDGTVVFVVHEATDRGDSQRDTASDRLSVLEETRERLLAARDTETVAATCVDAVSDGYGYDLACFRLESDNELQSAVMTPDTDALVADNPGFELGRSDAGRAYRTGEPVIREHETDSATGDLLATTLHFPLGEHGVLTVATRDERTVPPAVVDALALLAVSAETVLDRIEWEQRQYGQQAHQGSERATATQETISEMVSADSRDEVARRVCDRLADTARYSGAWIADVDATGTRLQLREATGVDEDVLAAIDEKPFSSVADGTVRTALDTGEVTVVSEGDLFAETRATGRPTDESVVIVPLRQGEKLFGVLSVHRSDTDVALLDKRRLGVLGETLSFVLSAIENERLLLSDEFVQLEFQVTDPDCLSVALSDTLDTSVTMRRTIRKADDEFLSYARIEDTDPDAAIAAAESIESVQDCRVVNDHEYGCLLEVTRASSGAEVMMEYGATMRRADADSGRGTLILEAPHTADVREIVAAYQSYNPQSELVTKRRVDRPLRTADQLQSEIEDELTDKQLSAVSVAYYSGYYEWPRESTAEEVAESIGISASTLHQHLRHAHRKLLTAILETSFSRRL
jgi:predicted DNA binding protein/PAS domain-containing protein